MKPLFGTDWFQTQTRKALSQLRGRTQTHWVFLEAEAGFNQGRSEGQPVDALRLRSHRPWKAAAEELRSKPSTLDGVRKWWQTGYGHACVHACRQGDQATQTTRVPEVAQTSRVPDMAPQSTVPQGARKRRRECPKWPRRRECPKWPPKPQANTGNHRR